MPQKSSWSLEERLKKEKQLAGETGNSACLGQWQHSSPHPSMLVVAVIDEACVHRCDGAGGHGAQTGRLLPGAHAQLRGECLCLVLLCRQPMDTLPCPAIWSNGLQSRIIAKSKVQGEKTKGLEWCPGSDIRAASHRGQPRIQGALQPFLCLVAPGMVPILPHTAPPDQNTSKEAPLQPSMPAECLHVICRLHQVEARKCQHPRLEVLTLPVFHVILQIWRAVDKYSEDRKKGMSKMWGGHLRFFRQLVSFPESF